ncbi:MAG: pimeloyl-ACP methyl ester carboxylesterase [Gammaproteobacteria bacterium]|jgi:pimeloyl-ACP methyl ester carboxylesterase
MSALSGPTSHTYFSQRLRLHYVDWGNPEAPPLLLVHGGRDHCRNWDWVARSLCKDYHVIAPDLRGHGDSQWISGGTYTTMDYVYDISQLIHQLQLAPLRIVSHSMGGGISLRYSGIYPDKVVKLVAIEGVGPSPEMIAKREKIEIDTGMRGWVKQMRKLSSWSPRRYPNIEEAANRMKEANPHLSEEQALHLTIHGINQNEDGTFSWKFDNYVRAFPATGMPIQDTLALNSKINCPTMLVRGTESWASDPETDGRAALFQNVRVENVENAGHWVHHDQLDIFLGLLDDFL